MTDARIFWILKGRILLNASYQPVGKGGPVMVPSDKALPFLLQGVLTSLSPEKFSHIFLQLSQETVCRRCWDTSDFFSTTLWVLRYFFHFYHALIVLPEIEPSSVTILTCNGDGKKNGKYKSPANENSLCSLLLEVLRHWYLISISYTGNKVHLYYLICEDFLVDFKT